MTQEGESVRKNIITLFVVAGAALLLAAFSIWAFPGWLDDAPGGVLALLGAAFLGVAALGGKLKDWRAFLFSEEEKPDGGNAASQNATRAQEMTRSPEGEQTMRGGSGGQKQVMDESPGGKQRME